ncbi:MAG TPA: ABC transporter permease [Patescibacteria group bacterium]|nr:ABC transporter permease [Patescibacteria group bacterium]
MKFSEFIESIKIAFESLRSNVMRSILAMLGIMIGITVVVLMGWALNGLDNALEDTINLLGTDMLYVDKWDWAGGGSWESMRSRKNISIHQANDLAKQLTSAELAIPVSQKWGQNISYGEDKLAGISVTGTLSEYSLTPAGLVTEGRFFSQSEDRFSANVVVIGYGVSSVLFPNGDALGKTIKIGGHPFEVIGVIEKRGTMLMDFVDNQVFIPLTSHMGIYGASRSLSIAVKAGSEKKLDEVRMETIGHMRTIRNVQPGADNDFSINESQAFREQTATMRAAVWVTGLILTGISLLVGLIGIMNIMFVSVTERTKEIGIRKAIGARRSSILNQFIVESAFLCFAGSLIAFIFSSIVAFAISKASGVDFLKPYVPPEFVLYATILSVIFGMLAGIIPAYLASRLDPVEALRYE